MNKSTGQDKSAEPGLSEVLVDPSDALMAAAQIEVKRAGLLLELWVASMVNQALAA